MAQPPVDHGWSWFVLLGVHINLMFVIGGLKSVGILFVVFQEAYGGTSATTAIVIGLINGSMSLLAPIATTFSERFQYRTVIMLGGVVACLGSVLTAFAPGLYFTITIFGLLEGIAFGMIFSPSLIMVGRYFNKKRSLSNGIALAGSSVGQLIIPQLLRALVDYYGFRGALAVYGAFCLNIIVAGALIRPLTFWTKRNGHKEMDTKPLHEQAKPCCKSIQTLKKKKVPTATLR